jgi:succinate dehydrogenase / fumarate reductase, membrane anchor subunit
MAFKSSMRTERSRVNYLGSARSGTRHLWAMRVTSVALLVLGIAFVIIMLSLVGKDYNAVRIELSEPFPAILLLLFILTGIYHMMIGMQVIIEDYVHSAHLREWAQIANICFSALVGLSCVYAVLKINF